MVAHRNDKTEMNERGALMIEAIALLGLMTMMSPMVVRQTADRTSEMEEVAIAGQIKELKDALSNWITSNYASEANTLNGSHTAVNKKSISASDLAPYLSSSMIDGANFRGNKLIDNYKLGVRQVCIEKQDTTSPTYATSPCNGADCGLSATIKCSRYKMTGVVLSDSGSQEIDDRRATRIASMVGADGGYMCTSKVSTALSVDKKKLLGTQGIWEGDVSDYFDDASVNTDVGGRVAATTVYAEGFAGDYLYRKPNSMPGANSMFTTLDMGGANENCDNGTNGACHQIKNAGGLEVVGGKIIIRSQNTGAGNDQTWTNTDGKTKIALGADKVLMNVSNDILLQGSTGGKLWLAADRAHLYKGDGSVKIDGSQSFMSYGESKFVATNSTVTMRSNDSNRLAINNSGTTLNTGNINTSASGYINTHTNSYINTVAGSYINMTASTDINADAQSMALNAATQATIRGGASTLTMENNNILLSTNSSSQLHMTNADIHMNAPTLINISSGPYLMELIGTGNTRRARIGYFDGSATADSNATFVPGHATVGTTGSSGTAMLNLESNSTPQIQLQTNIGAHNMGLFKLTPTKAAIELTSDGSDQTALELLVRNGSSPRIHFNGTDLSVSVFGDTSQMGARGKAIRIANIQGSASESNSPIAFYPESGRIGGSFFQPEDKIWNGSAWVNIVHTRGHLKLDTSHANEGKMLGNVYQLNGVNAAVDINVASIGAGAPTPYNVHDRDEKYDRFRVDPAFISVMNDIKITSRGGARLSEALPNYILKGIYVLSNSYRAGRWPCSAASGDCSFKMPYYTPADLGLTNGGEEFNCDGFTSGTHPAHSCKCENSGAPNTNSGGCDASTKYVKFDLYNSDKDRYIESDANYRWAHPFMGKVPAPGKFVKTEIQTDTGAESTEKLYSSDEGPCPDGYQAVMTVSPNAFEISRLLAVNPIYQKAFGSDTIKAYYTEFDGSSFTNVAANGSNYNYGYLPPDNETNRTATSIIQGGSRVGIVADKYVDETSGEEGWRVAMGTITPTNDNTSGFIWNFGGIPADSWSALAHTYCYFNPDRFEMPNMAVKGTADLPIVTPMDNPLLDIGNGRYMK